MQKARMILAQNCDLNFKSKTEPITSIYFQEKEFDEDEDFFYVSNGKIAKKDFYLYIDGHAYKKTPKAFKELLENNKIYKKAYVAYYYFFNNKVIDLNKYCKMTSSFTEMTHFKDKIYKFEEKNYKMITIKGDDIFKIPKDSILIVSSGMQYGLVMFKKVSPEPHEGSSGSIDILVEKIGSRISFIESWYPEYPAIVLVPFNFKLTN